ncbi:MAG: hypothetical protein J7L91_04605 [Candidatus Korarchaeota archaeon]|nr:hypothetical protein [Candidatus Korarchaeota archaeon]
MSIAEELTKELERNPELARKLARKLIEYIEPELTVSFQISKMVEVMKEIAEEQTKIWQEIKELTEEQVKLREDFNKMLEEIRGIKVRQDRFERELTKISESITYGFAQLSKFAGITFEQFVRMLLTNVFRKFGEIPEDAELTSTVLDGEEVDIFLEDPLIVGEVTAYAGPDELDKLLRKARKAEEIYGRRARLILIAETAEAEVAKVLRRRAKEDGVELIIGKEV